MHAVVDTDAYRREVLAQAPGIAARRPEAHGVLQGYDFHLGADGPRLIEINTNAGGVMLNAEMGRAQQACCCEVADLISGPSDYSSIEDRLFAMFMADWRAARGDAQLRHVAIVDNAPETQYLYPEFLLFQRLFEARGIRTTIADPTELELTDGSLRHASGTIDLLYNRLTDFYFERPEHAVLARAYETDTVVVTPHPHSHALYANKRNLALLTDATALRRWGIEPAIAERLLRNIPRTDRCDSRRCRRTVAQSQAAVLQTGVRLRQRRRVSRRQTDAPRLLRHSVGRLRGAGARAAERTHRFRRRTPHRCSRSICATTSTTAKCC